MNEELKIIIKAVTDGAKKGINDVKKQLGDLDKTGKKSASGLSAAFKAVGKAAIAVVATIAAVATALVTLGKSTLQFNTQQAKLTTAFQAMGMPAQQAGQSYKDFYRFLGDQDKAVEAASHLAKITQGEKELAEWAKISQGVYATFGDSLPIEGLTEAANETVRVGQVTGVMADALNWAGVSEDEFNAKLATTNSLEEREAMLRQTLNGLYGEAAEIYERNNKALLDYNASQANLDMVMGAAGQAVLPLMTALNNLGAAFFTALKPAIDAIVPVLATFVNWITQGIQAVTSFFSAITGKSTSIKAIGSIGQSAKTATTGLNNATQGAKGLSEGLGGTAKAAEEAKKSTQGFDELNIVSSGKSASGGGSGGGGGSSPAYSGGGAPGYGGGVLDPAAFTTEVEESDAITSGFIEGIKAKFAELKEVFAPSIEAWGGAFETIKNAWVEALPSFQEGLYGFMNGFAEVGSYIVNTFVPDIVNSFSVNLAPVFGDVLGFYIKETGLMFEWLGGMFNDISNDIIVPALEVVKGIFTDVFDIIGNAWAEYGQPFMDELSIAFENIRNTLTDVYNTVVLPIFNKVKEVVTDVWENGLKPVVEKVVTAAMEIGTCLLRLYNEFIKPIVDWIVQNIFPIIVNIVNKIIEVVGNIAKKIGEIIGGVVDVITGIVQFITGVFTGDWSQAWEGIKNIFGGVWDAICGIAGAAWETIKGVFSVVGSFFSGIWEGIKAIFSGVASWFGNIFSSAWNGIKKAFSAVSSFFSGVWNTIKGIFSSVGTAIANGIKGAVSSAVNAVLKTACGIINGFISAINFAIGIINAIPGVNIKKLKKLEVPKMAEGGIVDKATLAVIGEAGKEAVLPLEGQNASWMDKLAEKLTANNPTKVVLQVGETVLGWATINAINGITEQTGGLQLKL